MLGRPIGPRALRMAMCDDAPELAGVDVTVRQIGLAGCSCVRVAIGSTCGTACN